MLNGVTEFYRKWNKKIDDEDFNNNFVRVFLVLISEETAKYPIIIVNTDYFSKTLVEYTRY